MEVDSDIDGGLLQQFSCLGTTDRDVLISELQKLLGYQLNAAGCAFFLDMNNWNLQAAICSYFDFESPHIHLPAMSLIKDITVGDGEAVPPSTRFVKTWRLHNPSNKMWPPGCSLRLVSGEKMGHPAGHPVLVDPLAPHSEVDVSVSLVSPAKPGIYQAQWRMATATGHYFGEVIWVIVTVAEGGLLGVTQQMDAFHHLGSPPRPLAPSNPFALANPPPNTNTEAESAVAAPEPSPSIPCPSLSQLSPSTTTAVVPAATVTEAPKLPSSSDDMIL